MFPTLAYLIRYLFSVQLNLPINTLGFMVALAFIAAYYVFVAEFKRKEAEGKIKAFLQAVNPRRNRFAELVLNGGLGFLLGYKFVAILFSYRHFAADPKTYLFSFQGSAWAGLFTAALFIGWIYAEQRKDAPFASGQSTKTVHPYQLMGLITFSVGIAGVTGSKLFDIIENFQEFLFHPLVLLFDPSGLTYYGGLIFGALTYLYIGHHYGMRLSHLADIGSPGMMLAYGVGRIGCHLAGDGDWGVINYHPKPHWLTWLPDWMWAFRFPHNIINAGVNIPGCSGDHCNILVRGVYPTSFYEATLCILLFGLMWALRRKITAAGAMFFLYLILNGGERIFIQQIRVSSLYHVGPLLFSQAALIAFLMIAGGITGFAVLLYQQSHLRKQAPAP